MKCTEVTSSLGCWLKTDGSKETVGIVREYRAAASGELLLYKTRYARPDGSLILPALGEEITAGQCPVAQQTVLSAPGALLSANICVGSPIYVPSGNRADLRTVGTGGTYADYAAAMADATVVDGTILRSVSDVVDTVTVNVNRAVVIDFNGFTHSNDTSVTQFNVTAALAVLKDGVIHHTKVANTSIENVITINTTTGPAFVVDNTIKVQEFGVIVQGSAMIVGNKFEYAGASQTNSHRFIALYKITAETKIDNNEFTCSTIPATTRYSNFVYMGAIAGSTWTAPLWVTRNRQTGGSLRQFVFNDALVPVAGSQLIVAANSFNDFNGGVGLFSPALYNGLDKIVIVDNDQGGDASGNFKGVFFVDGTGTLDDDTEFVYGGNTTSAGALRADYLSLASDTDNIVAYKNTITPPAEPAVERGIQEALEDTGLLLQDLKGRRTHIVDSEGAPLEGYGTEADPFVLPATPAPELAAVTYGTAAPTGTAVEGSMHYVTTNVASPNEDNITEHWSANAAGEWVLVWKKEYMFLIQLTDSFDDETYYYYGGDVGPDWQVHRYLHDNPADPLYMIPEIAELSNNPGVTDLATAFADRTTLTYA